jgi:hypothetical protein
MREKLKPELLIAALIGLMIAAALSLFPGCQYLQTLGEAPLIACYRTTEGWSNANDAGCIDHADRNEVGNHAVLLVALGIRKS